MENVLDSTSILCTVEVMSVNSLSTHSILAAIRALGRETSLRLEVSSDQEGALGLLCCTATNADRSQVGFGRTIDEAIAHYRAGGTKACRPAGMAVKLAA